MKRGERIPLHDHSDFYSGGLVAAHTLVTQVAIGGTGGSSGPTTLDGLSDVSTTGVADADVLTYDAATGTWLPAASTGSLALDDLTDVNAPSPSDGDVLTWDSGTSRWVPDTVAAGGDTTGQIGAGFDGGLSILVAPKYQDVIVPFTGTLTGWHVYAQQTGDVTFGVSKTTYASFDTFSSIVGVASPSLSSAKKAASSGMTGWTTAVTAGDILRFTLSSVSSIRQVVVVLDYSRP